MAAAALVGLLRHLFLLLVLFLVSVQHPLLLLRSRTLLVAAVPVTGPSGMAPLPPRATGTTWPLTSFQGITWPPDWDALQANGTEAKVTALQGDTAFLPCKAYGIGQRTVSWVRRRDWHIIASGSTPYTADERFQVLHRPGSPDWLLQLRYAQPRDAGTYECQISTGRGIVSHFVHLEVATPTATIAEGTEYHVDAGSLISLNCLVEQMMSQLQYVLWHHNGRLLNPEDKGAGSQTKPRLNITTSHATNRSLSTLSIDHARFADSGNYTCQPSLAQSATVSVFVSQGDPPAAVQRQGAPLHPTGHPPILLLLATITWALTHVRW